MPSLRTEIESRYLSQLTSAEKRVASAGKVSDEVKAATEEISDRMKGIPGGEKLFNDAVEALVSAKPGKAIETFDNTVLPKIREAEAKIGRALMSDQQIAALRQQATQLEKIADKTQKARIVAGALATYIFGSTASGAVGKLGGQ
jgi:hypothetical protein